MSAEALVFVVRPDQTPLWLPPWIAEKLGVKRQDQLTKEQFASAEVQELLAARLAADKPKRG